MDEMRGNEIVINTRLNSQVLLARPLREDFFDHVSLDIGQSTLNSVVLEGQTLVVESQQMQDGRVEVIEWVNVLDRFLSKRIRHAMAYTTLHAGAS